MKHLHTRLHALELCTNLDDRLHQYATRKAHDLAIALVEMDHCDGLDGGPYDPAALYPHIRRSMAHGLDDPRERTAALRELAR